MHFILFTGYLAAPKDNELKHTAQGTPYYVMDVGVNSTVGSNEKTMWYRVTVWGKSAETAAKYATKGKPILVMGRPSEHEWTDDSGHKRTVHEVSASNWEFTGDGLSALFREAEFAERAAMPPHNARRPEENGAPS